MHEVRLVLGDKTTGEVRAVTQRPANGDKRRPMVTMQLALQVIISSLSERDTFHNSRTLIDVMGDQDSTAVSSATVMFDIRPGAAVTVST